uniref:Uncharacterized protein n=1 Tax=Fagus sylvatica TaxID=28930 RepID=A0A2N9F8K3_FAGSY
MDLLTNMDKSSEALRQNPVAPSNVKSMDFLQKFGGVSPSNSTDMASTTTNKADFRQGRSWLWLAMGSSSTSSGFVSTSASIMDQVNSRSCMAPESNVVATFERNTTPKEGLQQPPKEIGSDLPIARRASLHRFLEKRKDRATAKAPYQVNPPSEAPPKPEESHPWIEMEGQSSNLLELKNKAMSHAATTTVTGDGWVTAVDDLHLRERLKSRWGGCARRGFEGGGFKGVARGGGLCEEGVALCSS